MRIVMLFRWFGVMYRMFDSLTGCRRMSLNAVWLKSGRETHPDLDGRHPIHDHVRSLGSGCGNSGLGSMSLPLFDGDDETTRGCM